MAKSLIHRFLDQSINRDDLRKLQKQVNEDSAGLLKEMEKDWDESTDRQAPTEAVWENIQSQISEPNLRLNSKRSKIPFWSKVAASLILVMSSWLAYNYVKNEMVVQEIPEMVKHVNNSGSDEIVLLRDGTKVSLAANSSISYYNSFSEKYRVVHLEGEAFFTTDEQNRRPFVVISDNITSICRGNEFKISAFKEQDEISIISSKGSIEVAQNDKLNSERNKIAVGSCERYSFNKSNQQYLVGKISDCEKENSLESQVETNREDWIVML